MTDKLKHARRTAFMVGEALFVLLFIVIAVYAMVAVWNGTHERAQQQTEQQKPNADDWHKKYGGSSEIQIEDAK